MSVHRGNWIGALALLVLLLGACSDSDDTAGAEAPDIVTSDEDATVDGAAVDTVDAALAERDPAAPISTDAVYDPEAEPNLDWFGVLEPGTYRTGALGTPMSFTTTEPVATQVNADGMFVLTDIASQAPDDRELVLYRVGAFSDPAAPNASIAEQTPWPSDDFLGWLENLHEGVIATEPVETSVNGLAAIRVDLELSDDIECGWLPGLCVGLFTNHGHEVKAMNKGASYRVWIVEQGDEVPLAIVVGIGRDEDAPWFQRADAIMETIAFGDIAPNPIQQLSPGPNSLRTLGGIEVNLPDNVAELTNGRPRMAHRWAGRGFSLIPITDQPGVIYFADRPHDIGGNPLASSEDVVAELVEAGVQVSELESMSIDGVDARVFDITTAEVGAYLLRFSPLDTALPYLGWDAPAAGRLWLLEHPDRGLMMISTHAFEGVAQVLPMLNELGGAIVDTMVFTSGDGA